jgi:hypothetical protein
MTPLRAIPGEPRFSQHPSITTIQLTAVLETPLGNIFLGHCSYYLYTVSVSFVAYYFHYTRLWKKATSRNTRAKPCEIAPMVHNRMVHNRPLGTVSGVAVLAVEAPQRVALGRVILQGAGIGSEPGILLRMARHSHRNGSGRGQMCGG